jgi:hypothetical protein
MESVYVRTNRGIKRVVRVVPCRIRYPKRTWLYWEVEDEDGNKYTVPSGRFLYGVNAKKILKLAELVFEECERFWDRHPQDGGLKAANVRSRQSACYLLRIGAGLKLEEVASLVGTTYWTVLRSVRTLRSVAHAEGWDEWLDNSTSKVRRLAESWKLRNPTSEGVGAEVTSL